MTVLCRLASYTQSFHSFCRGFRVLGFGLRPFTPSTAAVGKCDRETGRIRCRGLPFNNLDDFGQVRNHPKLSLLHDAEEMLDLVVDFGWIVNGEGDFLAQQISKIPAQAGDGFAYPLLRHVQLSRCTGGAAVGGLAGQKGKERFEELTLAGSRTLVFEPFKHLT